MTDTTMTNGTMTNLGGCQRLKGAFREYFRGWSLPAAAKQAAGKVASGQEPRPQRLKPHLKQCSYRSAEALRHPKSRAKSSSSATCKVGHRDRRVIAALKSVRENSVVPPGLESFLPLFPALKRWAKLGRPSGAAFSCAWFHQTVRKRVLTHTLKRWATQSLASVVVTATSVIATSVIATTVIATSLCLLLAVAPAQTQNPTQAQTRQQLLQKLESGQFRDAVLLGQQAVSRWPRDAQFRHYLGLAYFETDDLKQAQEQLTRARELNPSEAATHFDLALVFLSQQDYLRGADELEASIKLDPTNARAHLLLGRAYLNSNRSLQAVEEFKTMLKLDPAMKLGHYHLGFAYFSLGRNDEAIGEYKEELRRSGESPVVVDALGHALLASGKYAAAVTYLRRGAELDSPNPDVWYDLGKALALAEQWAQAEPALRKAAELKPTDPSPHYQLARVLEKLGKTDEARAERVRFAELKKTQPATAGMATGRDQ
jgi:tetratricopeptide (TPR) repeat protein